MCNEIYKSVYALKKHLQNPLIHDFNKEFDPAITEVRLEEDNELKHTEEAKNKIITELKQQKDDLRTMVKTLQGEKHVLKEQTIPKVQKLENENKALREKLAKTMDALETSQKELTDLKTELTKLRSARTVPTVRTRNSRKKTN